MGNTSIPKILCVDDEPNILDAFRRQLKGQFEVDIATGGDAGLKSITERGPYCVIVSDMRMPGMDGGEFLSRARKLAPDSVRLMLTGNADQQSAVRAVNEGSIFRFLNKPCSTEDLSKALEDAVIQHRLITAEKDLLQNTLSGSVKLLTDILSFTDPLSFGQSMKLRQAIQKIVPALGLINSWEIELAGMLSNIGLVTVPSTVMAKYRKGMQLSPQEQELIAKVPAIGQSLLANIPRLEGVAKIVLHQNKHYLEGDKPSDAASADEIPAGSRIIKILTDLLQLEAAGNSTENALVQMKGRQGWYDPNILSVIDQLFSKQEKSPKLSAETQIFEIKSHQLFLGQTLLSNLETIDGVLLISAGSVITETLLERLNNYSKFVGIKEPIKVDCLIPTGSKIAHT